MVLELARRVFGICPSIDTEGFEVIDRSSLGKRIGQSDGQLRLLDPQTTRCGRFGQDIVGPIGRIVVSPSLNTREISIPLLDGSIQLDPMHGTSVRVEVRGQLLLKPQNRVIPGDAVVLFRGRNLQFKIDLPIDLIKSLFAVRLSDCQMKTALQLHLGP